MTRFKIPAAAFCLTCVLLVAPSPARAEDFTFEIPLDITRFAPRITAVAIDIDCYVSRALNVLGAVPVPSVYPSDLIARSRQTLALGPGPVEVSRTVTVAMNALSPRLRPASLGRYYACSISEVELTFPEGDTLALSGGGLGTRTDYETVTGHRLTDVVTSVQGEIPR